MRRNGGTASEDYIQDSKILITDLGECEPEKLHGYGDTLDVNYLFKPLEALLQPVVNDQAIRSNAFTFGHSRTGALSLFHKRK
jgi:hypothetical protein